MRTIKFRLFGITLLEIEIVSWEPDYEEPQPEERVIFEGGN